MKQTMGMAHLKIIACCYVDNINIVDGGIHTLKKIGASVVASKDCLAVNAKKT
jgi:hypothetical protein